MINETLTELRVMLGMSQDAAAKALKVSRSALGYYERGERQPDAEFIIRAAKHYGVTSDYLLGLSRNKTPENQAIAEKIPLSDAAIDFLSGCSGELLETLDWILSVPSAGEFLATLRGYIVEQDGTEIPDKYLPLLDHLNRTMSDADFLAFIDSWNWDGVEKSLKAVVKEAREKLLEAENSNRKHEAMDQLIDQASFSVNTEGSVEDGNGNEAGK